MIEIKLELLSEEPSIVRFGNKALALQRASYQAVNVPFIQENYGCVNRDAIVAILADCSRREFPPETLLMTSFVGKSMESGVQRFLECRHMAALEDGTVGRVGWNRIPVEGGERWCRVFDRGWQPLYPYFDDPFRFGCTIHEATSQNSH